MPPIPPWLWITAGWATVALGASLLLRGRLYRTKLKKPHCPRCRYCTQGLATLTCPECGCTVKSAAEFMVTPRRKRWRLAGVAVCLAGWLLMRGHLMIAHGWAASLPGWALALAAPSAASPLVQLETFYGGPIPLPPVVPAQVLSNTWTQRWRDELFAEAWRRVAHDEMAQWETRRYAERCLLNPRSQIAPSRSIPARWPWDAPIPSYDSDIFALAYTAEPLTGPATSVPVHAEVRIGKQTVYRGTVDVPIDATSSRENFLSRVSGTAIDQPVAAAIAARIVVARGQATIELSNRTDQEPWPAVDTIVDLRIRILLQGKEIGHATCDISNRGTAGSTLVPATWWEEGGNEAAAALPDLVELEITGDPAASTDRYLKERGTTFSTAWAGVAHVKPSVQRR